MRASPSMIVFRSRRIYPILHSVIILLIVVLVVGFGNIASLNSKSGILILSALAIIGLICVWFHYFQPVIVTSENGMTALCQQLSLEGGLGSAKLEEVKWSEVSCFYHAKELKLEWGVLMLESKSFWCASHLFFQRKSDSRVLGVVGFHKICKRQIYEEISKHGITTKEIVRVTEIFE